MTKDIDVSKIDVGWRVQLDATTFNGGCKKLHGVWATVSSLQEYGLYVVDDLEGWNRYINKDSRNFLAALPPEPAKDPFAVGEWVVCVEDDNPAEAGDFVQVYQKPKDSRIFGGRNDNAIKGYELYSKRKFRPATPEEIAAHLEKTATKGCEQKVEPEGRCDDGPEDDGKITFTLAGREFFVGQTVWATFGIHDRCVIGDRLIICGANVGLGKLCVRKPGSHSTFSIHPNSVSDTAHEWQFGDQASHPNHGKVLVIDMTEPESFQCASPSDPEIYIDPAELTFIRRTDLED